ncbi:MAG: hypothetical protein IJM67_00910, partial [Atopobiaceae bacterium]|nr:hypothetical protein [Atopobiaceae bacterium]
MRRTIRTLSILPIALCALLFLAPSRALAANYASPDEVFVNGTALSDNTPSGVSYNAASGTLTLNNFNGKTIFVQDSGTQP